MKTVSPFRPRLLPAVPPRSRVAGAPLLALFAVACALAVAPSVRAQFEIRGDPFTRLFQGAKPNGGTPAATSAQFSGVFSGAGGSSARDPSTTLTVRFPASTGPVRMVLHRAAVGNAFAAGVPRYNLGDTILPPTVAADGTALAAGDTTYWRAEPVRLGEVFAQAAAPTAETPSPLVIARIVVTAGGANYTSPPTVVLSGDGTGAAAVATVVQGAVVSVSLTSAGSGYTALPAVTFSGGGGSGAAAVAEATVLPYYYSPHAGRVFASQAGRVTVTWVTERAVSVAGDASLRRRFRTESFAVSSATRKPTRTIYWTERSFIGPVVNVPSGRIETVNPVFSALFPRTVDREYQAVGVSAPVDPSAAPPTERRTLWFERVAGIGQLRAYNAEGRLLVEYLGALKTGSTDVHEFLGADIVDVERTAPTVEVTVNLGDRLLPRDEDNNLLPLDGGSEWVASPVAAADVSGQSLYGSVTRRDGTTDYYAERENLTPDRVAFYWLEKSDAAIHFLAPPAAPNLGLHWPRLRNHYLQVWSDRVADYVHHTVAAAGGTPATGLRFGGGQLPQIVFQDDSAQSETRIDTGSQRLVVGALPDGLNRTLLKFTAANEVWYVRLFTQAENRAGYVEGDSLPAISAGAVVGQRLVAPAGHEVGGYVSSGTGYLPAAYADPFAVGIESAARAAIIPVNAVPGDNVLRVWWFKKIDAPSAAFMPFQVPAKVGTYTVSYPAAPDTIVLASNAGSGDLPASQAAGALYFQNDRTLPGYNPNEEHALLLAGRAYALRDDLNVVVSDPARYSSEPFVLLHYTEPTDGRPALRVFKVLREDAATARVFNYPAVAGTQVQAPMPLPLLPLPIRANGDVANTEVAVTPDSAHQGPAAYGAFTHVDRKGYTWVFRGPHAAASPAFGMQFYYPMQAGFWFPDTPAANQPEPGQLLPYLRPLVSGVPSGHPFNGTPLTINYQPAWPAVAPELRVAETLTLPKFGLPAVLTQASAAILYQQSIAVGGSTRPSVVLHDPIQEKTAVFSPSLGLVRLPASVLTSPSQTRTYFQGLPPHLQSRFFYEPARGALGTLVLIGTFVDEPTGEDTLNVNVVSADDLAAMKALASATDLLKAAWDSAVDSLGVNLKTYVEDPNRAGTYVAGTAPNVKTARQVTEITSPDTAVVDYAVTALGQGSGWVTMSFGDGAAFTPSGDPVSLAVFKVAPRLAAGELKVQPASNPLDEQVSLRHSADFAGDPSGYEFEWRYSPPVNGAAPAVYTYALTSRVAANANWRFAAAPAARLPTTAEYSAAVVGTVPRNVQIRTATAAARAADLPGLVAKLDPTVDFASGVPARIVFSAALGDANAGFVLYVNGVAALAYQAPAPFVAVPAGTGLAAGALARQFDVDPSYFRADNTNSLEVALYTASDVGIAGSVDFRLHASTETDQVVLAGSPWLSPGGTLGNQIVVGGSPAAPLGNPLLVMTDNWFTLRYRPKAGTNNVAGTAWSRWTSPKLVEGWIKRVLAGINPFNQRVTDLYNNAVNTDVSVLTQAGRRWEGDVALTLENIDQFGLIEIYETVLKRGRTLTVDAGYDYGPANDALLLAAGYLNDLYQILGNEAYADAANPTISVDDATSTTEINSSRFAFEGQVKSVLEEELALLRGRDDTLATSTTVAPAYNRLYWNYTRGINSGEALYAVNYNIREKSGSPTANGVLDAADAQRMFPQGHGDAYGHYLTALKGYTRLLQHPNFTWSPRSESVTVLGQPVQVDYFDERKFASAALGLARTAQQIIGLTHRAGYKDDPAAGWAHFRDGRTNPRTDVARHWGLDEWTARATQGAYFNWLLACAILPDVDPDPAHTGIQVIDRTTVPELREIPVLAEDFQTRIDNASARLNPLGLSPGAVAFDISPGELKAGQSHYDQIHTRALRAVNNAKGAFDQAARMTRLLRNQENQLADFNHSVVDQEMAFLNELWAIYGTPYPGEIGPGKTYAQGYSGPDLHTWFIIDRPTDLVDTTNAERVTVRVLSDATFKTGFTAADLAVADGGRTVLRTIGIVPDSYVQFSDVWAGGAPMGQRVSTGRLQQSLSEAYLARMQFKSAAQALANRYFGVDQQRQRVLEMIKLHAATIAREKTGGDKIETLLIVQKSLESGKDGLDLAAEIWKSTFNDALAEVPPQSVGLSSDVTSAIRAAFKTTGGVGSYVLKGVGVSFSIAARALEVEQAKEARSIEQAIRDLGFNYEQAQALVEYELAVREISTAFVEIAQLAGAVQRADEATRNALADGETVLAMRDTYRRRVAGLIQGNRTKDVTFRVFRNEALEQYRTLFDLAARYTYLSAKSYDYETGLLGSTSGRAVIDAIVASRSLGDLANGVPQATVSDLGDAGLAGTMARLQADWAVAKGRLGVNNPDENGTLFSLRRELFRLLDGAPGDTAWQQTLEQHVVTDIMADPDVAALARNLRKPDGGAVPGLVLPFSTVVKHGFNFFGLPSAPGDHNFSPSNYATKIYSVGLVLRGYIGMDPYSPGTPNAGTPNSSAPHALNATPYAYLLPVGTDFMLAPPLGDTGAVRTFIVRDQALPLPYNLGGTAFSATRFYSADGSLTETPWILRKHQAFRPVSDPAFFYTTVPSEFTSARLVGRSVWNGGWKLVIPAYTLMNNEQEGLNRFVASVKDIELFLRTYSHSGN